MPGRSTFALPKLRDLEIASLGMPNVPSPLQQSKDRFVGADERILACSEAAELKPYFDSGELPPSFEAAGPRAELFFAPAGVSCGIVTCGGLCPGVNDVIRSIVLTLSHAYGVRRILGFRYGYAGLSSNCHGTR